ncbi:MAG: hypothetical protein AAGI08_04640 [Bacteroidota bacterium]
MNTAGNRNRDLSEPVSLARTSVLVLLRVLVPPHADNEQAAEYLCTQIDQHDETIEWAVVRPDTLTDEEQATEYEVHRSPTDIALFDSGKTSRINAAHFVAGLITDEETRHTWKGQIPVIYNTT